MKFLIPLTLLFSFSAMAFNEVECRGRLDNGSVKIEVERAFPTGSGYRRAELSVEIDGNRRDYLDTVHARIIHSFGRMNYSGSLMQLEVDLWPHQLPQWGHTYRATLRSRALENQRVRMLTCRYM